MRTNVLLGLSIFLLLLAMPVVMIAKARVMRNDLPRIHLIQDMDNQGRFKFQQANPLFADGRAMRPAIPGTVARGHLNEEDHYNRGKVNGEFATTFPLPITEAMLQRGKERFEIYCAPCHGLAGYGNGIVAQRAELLQEGTWTPPLSYHDQTVIDRPVGHLFNSITNGIRTMPPYQDQIPVADRWAIVAYVRALQRSQKASFNDVPPEKRQELLNESP